MITNKHDSTEAGSYKVLRGLSTDSKPTGVANGSQFVEIDTGKTYLFNEDGAAWVEQPASGGGGGGAGFYDIALTTDYELNKYTMEETEADLIEQLEAGKNLRLVVDEYMYLPVIDVEVESGLLYEARAFVGIVGDREATMIVYAGNNLWQDMKVTIPQETLMFQTTGQNPNGVMSQKATTDMLSATHTASAAFVALTPSLLQTFVGTAGTHPGSFVTATSYYAYDTYPDESSAIKGVINAVYDDYTTHAKCFLDLTALIVTIDTAMVTSAGKAINSSLMPLGHSTMGVFECEYTSTGAFLRIKGFIPANA